MTQVKINEFGNLHFIFIDDFDHDVIQIHRLQNNAELQFIDNKCIGLELLNFERQLNRGKINNIQLVDSSLQDDNFIFSIIVDGQKVEGTVSLFSIE